jgi:SAM-dependent methyltransferase
MLYGWSKLARYRLRTIVTGGLPIPSLQLIHLVTGSYDITWFLTSGKLGAESILDTLIKNGLDIKEFRAILDFGCGVGRVIRYFNTLNGSDLYGTDRNPDLIAWCRKNLKFAEFQTNSLVGSLIYQDEQFDFIYALSVFTHLSESSQNFWIKELFRVLKPGGNLYFSVHGEKFYLPQLLVHDQERFRRGELVVYGVENEGSNICTAFHPDEYVRQKMARDLKFVDHVPEGATSNPRQDVYLFQKPVPSPV